MIALQNIFSAELIEAIGWTLIHSLWQGAVIVVSLAILLLLMRRNSAQLKYFISFIALILILGWSSFTFVNSFSYAKEKSALKENITADRGYIKTLLTQSVSDKNLEGLEGENLINLRVLKIRSFFQRYFNTICTFWIIGMCFLIVRMIGGFIYAHRLRTFQLIDIGDEWLKKIEALAFKLNISRKVQAFFSPLAKVPLTLGTLKPVIVFPIAAFTGLSVKDIEAILAHELAHVLRHDYFFNIIQSMVEILFFYHPAVWIISAQIRSERENSCDNIAIELTGDKVAYVKALAKVQINNMEQRQLAMAFASRKGRLLQRIKRLQKQVAMKTNFLEGLIAAGVIVIGLFLVSFTMGKNMNTQVMPENLLAAEALSSLNSLAEIPLTKEWTKEKVDSVQQSMEKNLSKAEEKNQVSDELERIIEVALSEQNEAISAEMMEEINAALNEINVGEIIQAAMREAKQAMAEINMAEIMEEAKADIDHDEIRRDMEEARRDIEDARREMREEMRRDMKADNVPSEIIELSIKSAEAGLNAVSAILENLPLDEIISAALSGVGAAFDAFGEIDFETFQENETLTEEDINRLKEQLEQEEKKLKIQKEKLKENEKELKKNK